MYASNVINRSYYFKILEGLYKMYEQTKLLFKLNAYKHKEDSSYKTYLRSAIRKGHNIILLGVRNKEDLFMLRQLLGRSGKLISFISESDICKHLADAIGLLKWKNVLLTQVQTSNSRSFVVEKEMKGAVIIDINERIFRRKIEVDHTESITDYCMHNNIKPDLIKICQRGSELQAIDEMKTFLKLHKPIIVVECDQRFCSRNNILSTFKLLESLNYKGFFFLDTLRIPVKNFDFDIYQNDCKDFYCSTFIFE